jgi:hypothetical protein
LRIVKTAFTFVLASYEASTREINMLKFLISLVIGGGWARPV